MTDDEFPLIAVIERLQEERADERTVERREQEAAWARAAEMAAAGEADARTWLASTATLPALRRLPASADKLTVGQIDERGRLRTVLGLPSTHSDRRVAEAKADEILGAGGRHKIDDLDYCRAFLMTAVEKRDRIKDISSDNLKL